MEENKVLNPVQEDTNEVHKERVKGPANQPRPGHMYASRKWNYETMSWEYEYGHPSENRVHEEVPIIHPEDDLHTSGHHIPEEESSGNPKEDYLAQQTKFLNTPKIYTIDYPKIGKVVIQVKPTVDSHGRTKMGYIAVSQGGDTFGPAYSYGDLEKQIVQEASTENFLNKDGELVARIVPTVGSVTTEDIVRRVMLHGDRTVRTNKKPEGEISELIPAVRPHMAPSWIKKRSKKKGERTLYYKVIFNPKFYTDPNKSDNKFSTKERATRAIAYLTNTPLQEPTERNTKHFTDIDLLLRNELASSYKTNRGTEDRTKRLSYGRHLDIPEDKKEELINKVASDFYPLIWKITRSLVREHPLHNLYYDQFNKDDKGAVDGLTVEAITGFNREGTVPTFSESKQIGKENLGKYIKLTKTSPVYQAINHELDNYGLDGRSIFQRLAGTYRTVGNTNQLFGSLRRHILEFLHKKEESMGISPETGLRVRNIFSKEKSDNKVTEDVTSDTTEELESPEEDIVESGGEEEYPEDLNEIAHENYEDEDEEDDDNYGYTEKVRSGKPKYTETAYTPPAKEESSSNKKENLEAHDIPYDAPEILNWVQDQKRKLLDAYKGAQNPEQKAHASTIHEFLSLESRKSPEHLKQAVEKLQDVLEGTGLAHAYLPVLPYIKHKLYKKSLDFVRMDLMKAKAPEKQMPDLSVNPEYYSPTGELLNRAVPNTPNVEWNPAYSNKDKNNLWMAKWTNEETGNDEFSYSNADISNIPDLDLHNKLVIFATRINKFREYIANLTNSGAIKDKITGLILMLVDQGMFELREVLSITPEDIEPADPLVKILNKVCYVDARTIDLLVQLMKATEPGNPIFTITTDSGEMRLVGPNYINSILNYLGVTYEDLKIYQVNRDFFTRKQRLVNQGISLDNATLHAAISVMKDLGYVGQEDTPEHEDVLTFFTTHISPVEIHRAEREAEESGTPISGKETPEERHSIPLVNMNLEGETPDEKTFNQVLHSTPVHEYL